jgi:hypothetical protein
MKLDKYKLLKEDSIDRAVILLILVSTMIGVLIIMYKQQ